MKIPAIILRRLHSWADKKMASRPPDFVIQPDGREVYLKRWWVIPRNRFFNIYLHLFLKSDDDRACHDHPWVNASILLRGVYKEHILVGSHNGCDIRRVEMRYQGHVYARPPASAHRVQLIKDLFSDTERSVITLFITGPKVREWGFHCPKGWRHWREFTNVIDGDAKGSEIGRGCE